MSDTMPTLTIETARALESSFEGRITSSHDANDEFRSKPTVLIPESTVDVERALRLARAADRHVFVRSGHSVSSTDVSKSAAAIVSMEAFRDIDVGAQLVTVGAAATTAEVAKKLANKSLFLPLDDNPTQSIVSAVLSMDGSPFPRSGAGLDSLRGAVAEAEVVPIDGDDAGIAKILRNDELRDLWAGSRRGVITRLVFDAAAWKTDESERWMQFWMTPYDPSAFATLCDALFRPGGSAVPKHVDLTVRVTSAAFSMKLVILRITGHGDADRKAAEAAVQDALDRGKCVVLASEWVAGPGSSIAAWVTTGAGSARAQGDVQTRFGSNAAPRPFAGFRQEFLEAVDFAIGVDAATGRERAPGIEAWAELQLALGVEVMARAQIADATAESKVALEAQRRMARAVPADNASPTAAVAPRALLRHAPARAALRGVEVLPGFTPTPDFNLSPSNRVGSGKIPDFEGDVLDKSDGKKAYRDAVKQYAVFSYPSQVVESRMRPRLVAEPKHAMDVVRAVAFAAKHGLKIVARSGGHQYCGLSSGGDNTVVLDMKLFTKIAFSPDTDTPTQVTVGPGVRLRDLSTRLREKGVVLPHGECPLVNIGGHVQTGGIGHQLRSLGATLDWVRSFKMVTRNPQSGADVYEEREFTMPQAEDADAPTDGDVFKAVLGGGPGSWGVVTEITFDLVPDSKFPASHGDSRTYLYNKAGFRAAMEQLRLWAARAAADELPAGMDLFLTVLSGELSLFRPDALLRPSVLVVETMCRDEAGVQEIRAVVSAVQKALPIGSGVAADIAGILAHTVNGREKLSVIADVGVRRIGPFGLPASGREFDLPYKKSLYITKTPFSKAFCDRFVDLVDRVNGQKGVEVVFQAVVGGGEFGSNGQRTTHMQRRDALVQLVFDVFYEPGHQAEAEEFQTAMKALLPEFSGGESLRMFWGTFEDVDTNGKELDMSRNNVQNFYYDSKTAYERLQQIKKYIDPGDIFHTSFTVQLPG
ncbi:FAD-binding oxidoreductase [Polyangium mundeleinium]|uniref:FAD-binding protein n=1 Tax=Polyangium mundeleinium TaxID=2995306 RepID=A0ABT5EPT8_9BACT|nr:FAD-binding protein [Polyangium mundeleinium]MDC0743193.1 FAD-binding protein [Polyangium mundeleinium]